MKLYQAGETKVAVHPLALAACLVMCILGYAEILLAYLIALFIHEGAHYAAASRLHASMTLIELTPFGGVAAMEAYYTLKPSQQVRLAAAGPLANALAAASLTSLFYFQIASPFLVLLFKANLMMLFFNLLPVLPMDGGKVLHAMLCQKINWRKSVSMLALLGVFSGIALLALAGWGIFALKTLNLSLVLTGCYLIYAASLSKKTVITECLHGIIASRARLERNGVMDMALIAASSRLTVAQLMARVPSGKHLRIVVIDDKTLGEIGEIRQQDFEKAIIDAPGALIASLIPS